MTNKTELYEECLPAISAMIANEPDLIAKMATIACELHHRLPHFHWTGFYRVIGENLVIGPYQGSHGCLRIAFDRGVCGKAFTTKTTQVIADVHAFDGHIACSATTRSEIVVPVIDKGGNVIAVLDIDSDDPAAFDSIDQTYLEKVVLLLGKP